MHSSESSSSGGLMAVATTAGHQTEAGWERSPQHTLSTGWCQAPRGHSETHDGDHDHDEGDRVPQSVPGALGKEPWP